MFGVLLLVAGPLHGQGSDTLLCGSALSLTVRWATVNVLGQVCAIRPDNAVEKYSATGQLLVRYSDNRSGTARYLDVSNPLKTLVWYGDFRMAVFLDRSFTPLGMLNLIQAGFPEVKTVAVAQDGQLWIYDEVRFRLVKISTEGQLLYESQPLNQILGNRVTLTCIRERDGRVWASDPGLGWLEFDSYAQFQRLIPEEGIQQFEISSNHWIWIRENQLWKRSFKGFTAIMQPMAVKPEDVFMNIARNHVVIADGHRIKWCDL